ncbi:hypothetical protein [Pantoea sp. R13S299]|uniref:hypothetical protein n=1 Tax=Pantoea sp. R13S299 TaxID=3402751 RepID=UPI003AE45433
MSPARAGNTLPLRQFFPPPAADRRRLCYQQPLARLTPATFSAFMLAFIQLAGEVRL